MPNFPNPETLRTTLSPFIASGLPPDPARCRAALADVMRGDPLATILAQVLTCEGAEAVLVNKDATRIAAWKAQIKQRFYLDDVIITWVVSCWTASAGVTVTVPTNAPSSPPQTSPVQAAVASSDQKATGVTSSIVPTSVQSSPPQATPVQAAVAASNQVNGIFSTSLWLFSIGVLITGIIFYIIYIPTPRLVTNDKYPSIRWGK